MSDLECVDVSQQLQRKKIVLVFHRQFELLLVHVL